MLASDLHILLQIDPTIFEGVISLFDIEYYIRNIVIAIPPIF
jgi:hypothetical protein